MVSANSRRMSPAGGSASPPTPPMSGFEKPSAMTSASVARSDGDTCSTVTSGGGGASAGLQRVAQHVFESARHIAARGELPVHRRIGQRRDFRLQPRTTLGKVRLDVGEDGVVDFSRESHTDELVAGRVALREHTDAAVDVEHSRALKLAGDSGAEPSFCSIDARGEVG